MERRGGAWFNGSDLFHIRSKRGNHFPCVDENCSRLPILFIVRNLFFKFKAIICIILEISEIADSKYFSFRNFKQ